MRISVWSSDVCLSDLAAAVALTNRLADFDARSAAVDAVLRAVATGGAIPGWRDEPYPVTPVWGRPPLMRIERAACPVLGIRAWGVHMNGYVRRAAGLHLWVARRARDTPTYPGLLDHTVAGGRAEERSGGREGVRPC